MKKIISRRRKKFEPSLNDAVSSLMKAQLSSVVALAVVVFAAGSVMAMAYAAAPELAMSQDVPNIAPAAVYQTAAQVLGVTTSIDSQLEAGDPSASLSAKPVGFDSVIGRWDYTISYKVSNVTGSAQVVIGSYVLKDGITDSGSVETGNILKPGRAYRVSLRDGSGLKLAAITLKTGKAKQLPIQQQCLLSPNASSTPSDATSTPSTLCGKIGQQDQQGDNHGGNGRGGPGGTNSGEQSDRLPPPPQLGSTTPLNFR